MYPFCKTGPLERSCNETRPLQILLNDQRLVCFLAEDHNPLNLSDVSRLLGIPQKSRGTSLFDHPPVLSTQNLENGFTAVGHQSSIRDPSAFIRLFLKTAGSSSVAMVRWLVQEVTPATAIFKDPRPTVTDDPELMQMLGRDDSQSKGQILVSLKTIRTGTTAAKSSTSDQGGETCLKR